MGEGARPRPRPRRARASPREGPGTGGGTARAAEPDARRRGFGMLPPRGTHGAPPRCGSPRAASLSAPLASWSCRASLRHRGLRGAERRKLALHPLLLREGRIEASAGNELLVRAVLDDAPPIEHEHLVASG